MGKVRPQTRVIEVQNFLSLHHTIIDPNKIELIRWLRDARALRASDPVAGYMMEGLVYRAQGKLCISLKCVESSYRLDWIAAGNNYAFLLGANGYFENAIEVCLRIIKAERTQTVFLEQLMSHVAHTLDKASLEEAIGLFVPTNIQATNMVEEAKSQLSSFDDMLSNLAAADISKETYINFQRIVSRVRNSNYMGTSEVETNCEENELGVFLVVEEFLSNSSIDDCLRMNDELIDAIIDDDYPFEEYKKIIFNFRPACFVNKKEYENEAIKL